MAHPHRVQTPQCSKPLQLQQKIFFPGFPLQILPPRVLATREGLRRSASPPLGVRVCSAPLPTGAALGNHTARVQTTAHPPSCRERPLCFSGPTPSERAPSAGSWAPGDPVLSLHPRACGAGLEGAVEGRGSNKTTCPSNLGQQPLSLSHSARLLQSSECFRAVKRLFCSEHMAGQLITAVHVM